MLLGAIPIAGAIGLFPWPGQEPFASESAGFNVLTPPLLAGAVPQDGEGTTCRAISSAGR
jgi:hypothetical protein